MLDTNVVSAEFKGHSNVGERLRELSPDQWCISAITHSELLYGAALMPHAVKLARLLDKFFSIAQTAPWDTAAATHHASLRAHLRLSGTPIGDLDEMIAAHALALNLILVTDNVKHFSRVPGLRIENWLRGT